MTQKQERKQRNYKKECKSLIDKLLAQGYTKNKIKTRIRKRIKRSKTHDIDIEEQKQFRAHRTQQYLVFMTRYMKIEWFHIGNQSISMVDVIYIYRI